MQPDAIILAIDPGSRRTGFGVIRVQGSRHEYVTSGCINLVSQPSVPARLDMIFNHIQEIAAQVSPTEFAIEQVFMGRNADSTLKLGQARGAAIVAAMQAGLPVYEYAARQIKQSVVGRGGADKAQVQHMVMALLRLPGRPQEDAADALAIALCHAQYRQGRDRLGGLTRARRGRLIDVPAAHRPD